MSISISGSLATTPYTAANSSSSAAPAAKPQQTTADTTDTVKLSESQQVQQLYNQGQRSPEIASNLGLTVQVVNTYLGISSPTT